MSRRTHSLYSNFGWAEVFWVASMQLSRALVVRPGALGDAVLTLPLLAALKRAGAASMMVLGTPASWRFLNKDHHDIWALDFGSRDWLHLFDDSISPTPVGTTARTADAALVYLAGDGEAVCRRLRAQGVKKTCAAAPPRADDATPSIEPKHAALRLLKGLEGLLGAKGVELPDAVEMHQLLHLKREEIVNAAAAHRLPLDAYVVLHPGSGGARKCWAAERYAQLARKLRGRNVAVAVTFGEADEATRAAFDAALGSSVSVARLIGRPIREVLALLAGARGYAGNDSGVSHLAACVTAVTALFGPTDAAVWAPLGEDVRVLSSADGVLDSIPVEQVVEIVLR
jgi:heptosyltransferase III